MAGRRIPYLFGRYEAITFASGTESNTAQFEYSRRNFEGSFTTIAGVLPDIMPGRAEWRYQAISEMESIIRYRRANTKWYSFILRSIIPSSRQRI